MKFSKTQKTSKHIAIFCWRDPLNPKAGGAEYVTLRHAQAWLQAGHQVTWFSATVPGAQNNFTKYGIEFYRFGTEKLFFLNAGWMYWTYKKHSIDLIIDQVHGLPNLSTLWAPYIPKILLIHEVAGKIWEYMFPWPLSRIGQLFEAAFLWIFYRNTRAWVDAECTKNDLVAVGLDPKNIYVIPCAIDHGAVLPQKKETQLTLIFLARLVPMKGILFALRIFKILQHIVPSSKLWIVGGGEKNYVKHLHYLVRLSGLTASTRFFGKLSELEKMKKLRQAHFLLHTSVKEGFGLTVLEANAQKTPVAIFDIGSLNELVTDKKTGVVAPFHNEKLLAYKIYSAYKSPIFYNQLCRNAYIFQKRYNWVTFVQMSTDLVEGI